MFLYLHWWSYLIIVPGLLFAVYAQASVNANFSKYSRIGSKSGWTASDLSRMLLEKYDCKVVVRQTKGHLTDNYNPQTGILSLSASTYNSTSIAALGVAAHEVGHAVQHEQNYLLLKLRSAIVPVVNIGSRIAIPLVIIGVLLEWFITSSSIVGATIISVGIICYSLATVFCLITLPVELNASRRARKLLLETGVLDEEETRQAGKVLNAAALTYVASLAISLLYFLRFLLILSRFRKND